MLLIMGTVRLPEGGLDRARAAMEKMVTASRAESGCFTYDPGFMATASCRSFPFASI